MGWYSEKIQVPKPEAPIKLKPKRRKRRRPIVKLAPAKPLLPTHCSLCHRSLGQAWVQTILATAFCLGCWAELSGVQ